MTNVNVDTVHTDKLLRLLDTVVIKLEGGTEEDLKVLDEKPVEIKSLELTKDSNAISAVKKLDNAKNEEGNEDDDDDDVICTEPDEAKVEQKKEDEGNAADETAVNIESAAQNDNETAKDDNKRKRTTSESSSSSHSSSSDSSDNEDDDDEEGKKDEAKEKEDVEPNNDTAVNEVEQETVREDGDVEMRGNDEDTNENTNAASINEEDKDDEKDKVKNMEEETNAADTSGENVEGDDKKDEEPPETIDLDKEADPKEEEEEKAGPRALHRTSSIFLRNLAPTITKAEVEAMCKRYNGFLRVAIADPLVERRWFRRGWVTFKRDTNIKEICWNLNNIRLRDCELGAIVNRDLSRRVRPVNGITAHKAIVRSDIKLGARIAHNLDTKAGLWQDPNAEKTENGNQTHFGLNSNNPVLQNITDYLIEEASAEEDELLGLSTGDIKDNDGEQLERDQPLINVLDKLILYLRIVHSVDFYNHCEYPYEDEMPNRCGIIHARGPPPQNKISNPEIQDYIRNFESKMSSFLAKSVTIDEVELKKIGCKDVDAEVEKFIQANTQELAKDKWLCPLSGKKFKGPEFIRKHIFNKHGEKVDEVKKEVEYFNNYLRDTKRPQLPEHPGNTKKQPAETQQPQG